MEDQSGSKLNIRLPLILAATLAAGMFIGQKLPHYDRQARFIPGGVPGRAAGVIDEILQYVNAKYVDTVNIEHLKADAITHMLDNLDPHTVYITPDELESVEDDMNGGFEGIGVEFIIVDDTIQVVAPISGGPSETAGILPGDKIVTISDTTVAGIHIDNGQIFKRLRGVKGSQVKIGIRRGVDLTLRYFTIARDVIPVKSVDVAYMLDDHTGYVKINRFSARTYQEFMEAVRPLAEDKGMQNLVLDLRGNPGGYLNEATDLLSQFFPEGKLLVYTKGRTEERHEYKSNGHARFNIRNIAVLIDEGSASASEIVAGAIQDHDRGWIIGRRSFGKGLVQEQYPLGNGGALRLTVSRYYTPSGRSIQRDYKNDHDYRHEAERRLKDGELSGAVKAKLADSTQYYTGLGRVVYGGGGINPDVFIPLDTSYGSEFFFNARQRIPQFVARWMENHERSSLPADIQSFVKNFQANDELVNTFLAFLGKEQVKVDGSALAKCKNELKLELKARFAKVLFQDIGLYSILNHDDPAVDKALQVLKSGEPITKK